MPRIAFTIPIMPGRQEECIRLLKKYKEELDQAHKAVRTTQWCKFIDRDEYVEFVDWKGCSFIELLRDYLARPELEDFLSDIGPNLIMPAADEGEDQAEVLTRFFEGRAMNQAYAQGSPPE